MMDFDAVFQGLADAASAIAGLRSFPGLPDSINPPTFAPIDLTIEYNQAFGASSLTLATVTAGVYVSRGDTLTGRAVLAGYMAPTGDGSIKAALEADKSLAGAAKTLNVDRLLGAYRLYTIGATDYLGATFSIRVWG